MSPFLRGLGCVLKSLFTGPDGESYAPGRFMAAGVFLVSEGVVIFATMKMGALPRVSGDWATFFNAIALFHLGMAATCTGLILGQAPTDPGGKWWGKEGSPPPPAQ